MVKPMLIPTNKLLAEYALQRPNFYLLRKSPDVENRGDIVPVTGPHGLRWVQARAGEAGVWSPVSVEGLRLAQIYVHQQYRDTPKTLYLFISEPSDGRKSTRYYYTVPEQYIDVWFDEPRRMKMLRDLEDDEKSQTLFEEGVHA